MTDDSKANDPSRAAPEPETAAAEPASRTIPVTGAAGPARSRSATDAKPVPSMPKKTLVFGPVGGALKGAAPKAMPAPLPLRAAPKVAAVKPIPTAAIVAVAGSSPPPAPAIEAPVVAMLPSATPLAESPTMPAASLPTAALPTAALPAPPSPPAARPERRRSATLVGIPSPLLAPEPKTAEVVLPPTPPGPEASIELGAAIDDAPGGVIPTEPTRPDFRVDLEEPLEVPIEAPGAMAPPPPPMAPAVSVELGALGATPPAAPIAPPVLAPALTAPMQQPSSVEVTPVLPIERPAPRRRWVLPVAAVSVVLLLAVVGGVVAFQFRGPTVTELTVTGTLPPVATATPTTATGTPPVAPTVPPPVVVPPPAVPGAEVPPAAEVPPTAEVAPTAETPPTAEVAPTAETPPPPAVAAPAPTATGGPIAPTDPIEGREADFDLVRLGITPVERPSASTLARRVSRLLASGYRDRSRHRYDSAAAAYGDILAMDPTNARATAGLALVAADRGEPLVALVFAQRLVRLRPTMANNYVLLGDCYVEAGDPAAARRAFEHALELEPGHAEARRKLAALP